MKKQLMLITGLLSFVAVSAQIKTSELEVRTPTTSTVNEIEGETKVKGKVTIQHSTVGGTIGTGFDNLILEENGNVGLTLKSPDANNAGIAFANAEDSDIGRIVYRHNTDRMSFIVNNGEKLSIVNNNVGIGIVNPAGKLHIRSSEVPGGSAAGNYDNLIVEQNGANIGMTFLSKSTNNAGIAFSNDLASNRGIILYGHGDDRMAFYTAGAERARILANGNFGIGTGAAKEKLDVNGAARIGTGVGIMKIDAVFNEQANNYVRGSLISSRDGDLEWNKNSNQWTLGSSSSSNDFAAILHTNPGELQFITGRAGSFTSIDNNSFRNAFQRMTINGDGKVGIGTRTPGARLDVKSANQQLRLTDSDDDKYWQLSASSNALAFRYQEGASDENLALWLDDAGQVGIGTSSPTSKVTIDEPFSRLTMGAIDGEFRIRSTRLNNYIYSDLVLSAQENVILMPDGGQSAYSGQGKVGIGTNNPIDLLTLQQSGPSGLTFSRSNHDQYRLFLGNSTGLYIRNGSDGRDEMVFDGTGKIGIGTESPSQKLHVNGNVLANNVSVSSDRRWKKNINEIKEASTTLNVINPISYELRSDEFPNKDFDEKTHYGVIAQELEKVLPELVSTDN